MKPSTGETICVFVRVIFSSSSLALDCSNCACARSSCATRRLMPRVDVIERLLRQQLTLEQAARAVEAGLRQLEVRLPLANRRLRDLIGRLGPADLLAEFAVLDTGDDLAFPHRIAQLDVHHLQAPVGAGHDLDGCRADQVADDHDLLGNGGALDRGELDRHGGAGAAPAAGGRTTTCRVAAAVVNQNAGQADDGDDDDCDCSSH